VRIREPHPPAHQDDRSLRRSQIGQQPSDLCIYDFQVETDRSRRLEPGELFGVDLGLLNIQWNIEQHRTWSPALTEPQRFLQLKTNVFWFQNHLGVLRHRCRHGHDVRLLKSDLPNRRIGAQEPRIDLTG
jgi:hypothetical protein